MQTSTFVLVLLGLAALAYRAGRSRSLAVAGGPKGIRNLHSLTALWCAVPALIVLGIWHAFDHRIVVDTVLQHMPAETRALPPDQLGLVLNDVRNVVDGNVPLAQASPA